MANTLLNKNTELNNLAKDYSIVTCTNSYILNYNASLVEVPYDKNQVSENISQYLTLDLENRIGNFQASYNIRNEFNFTYTYYQSNYNLIDNSLIISNLANDDQSAIPNSYIIFYNTFCGLKQLSYHYKEGNGLYYDAYNHVFNMNIDNSSIKEINKKLFFDTNSIPISSKENYGISYVNTKYLTVNNGILSIDLPYIENIISYKYKIKNLFQSLTTIHNSLSYYDNIYETKNDTIDTFKKSFDIVSNNISKNIIDSTISYNQTNSLYFPQSEIKYIDNYYFQGDKPLIDPKYKEFVTLDENNSYIIYCKDIEKIQILSYISNDFINYKESFDINKIKDIESNILNDELLNLDTIDSNTHFSKYINENKQETIDNNNLYSYIYVNETNDYNKFIIQSNIINNSQWIKDDKYYKIITIGFKYNSKFVDEKLFKKLGIIVNSKISLPQLKKNILKYNKKGKSIEYDYTVETINCNYEEKNIKILYDTRNITYCTHNTTYIPYNPDIDADNFYFLSDYNFDTIQSISKPIVNIMKNFDISFDNKIKYLFYGCNWNIKDNNKFTKNYYGIWNDLPTYYVTSSFMETLLTKLQPGENQLDEVNKLPLSNFLELYCQNFNEIEFDKENYETIKLYLYKIYPSNEQYEITKVPEVTINI